MQLTASLNKMFSSPLLCGPYTEIIQTPFYETPEHRHTQSYGRFACTFPPPRQTFHAVPT
jgi:hypothetical protein